jgi:hypothetical protein
VQLVAHSIRIYPRPTHAVPIIGGKAPESRLSRMMNGHYEGADMNLSETSPAVDPATGRRHLYLVDGSAYIFRAYHRLPPLTNPAGTPVGAVYGYTTMLWKLAEDLHKADGPTHLAVILDKAGRSFRNDIYPEYKANRPRPRGSGPPVPLIAKRHAPSAALHRGSRAWRRTISSPMPAPRGAGGT